MRLKKLKHSTVLVNTLTELRLKISYPATLIKIYTNCYNIGIYAKNKPPNKYKNDYDVESFYTTI